MRTLTMGLIFVSLGLLGLVALFVAAVLGYRFEGETAVASQHIVLGLVSVLLVAMSHSWMFFFLLGTGRAARLAIDEHGLAPELAVRSRRLRRSAYPWLLSAAGLTIADFLIGAWVYTGDVAISIHHWGFYITAVIQVGALVVATRSLFGNDRLMLEIDDLSA